MHGRLIVLVSIIILGLAEARGVLAQDASPVPAAITLPAPTGPYVVGRTSFEWVDVARDERFTDDPADHRELIVWLWYPAEPRTDAELAPYLPGIWGELVGEALGMDLSSVHVHAILDAPVASEQQRYPLVIVSPGNGFMPAVYTALAEELASHGFVVAGVNHTHNANVTVFADGRVVPASPAAQPQPQAMGLDEVVAAFAAITAVHAADVEFVLDRLEALDDEPGPLQGRLDLSRVGLLGGSLGGAVAAEVCRVDRRCDAGVNMDGVFWGEAAETGVPVPFLLLMAEHPPCAEQAEAGVSVEQCEAIEALFAASWDTVQETAQPGYWVVIAGSRHGSYSDAPFLPGRPEIFAPLVGGATIESERMWRVTSDLLLVFFNAHLSGRPSPPLDGPSPEYPDVQFVEEDL
jgi:predicted dienelactone hydrolase